jgi:hypothetical protein
VQWQVKATLPFIAFVVKSVRGEFHHENSIIISYDMATHSPLWNDTWSNRAGLPAAVRITLAAERNGRTLTATGRAFLKLAAGVPAIERPVEY